MFRRPREVKEAVNQSSVKYDGPRRILTLRESDCGLVLHDDGQCQVIFTKFKDGKSFTQNQELLMALSVFLRKKQFNQLLVGQLMKLVSSQQLKPEEETTNE